MHKENVDMCLALCHIGSSINGIEMLPTTNKIGIPTFFGQQNTNRQLRT
jgi:hypothetical protein